MDESQESSPSTLRPVLLSRVSGHHVDPERVYLLCVPLGHERLEQFLSLTRRVRTLDKEVAELIGGKIRIVMRDHAAYLAHMGWGFRREATEDLQDWMKDFQNEDGLPFRRIVMQEHAAQLDRAKMPFTAVVWDDGYLWKEAGRDDLRTTLVAEEKLADRLFWLGLPPEKFDAEFRRRLEDGKGAERLGDMVVNGVHPDFGEGFAVIDRLEPETIHLLLEHEDRHVRERAITSLKTAQ